MSFLPGWFVDSIAEARQKYYLSIIPKQKYSTKPLMKKESFAHEFIFSDIFECVGDWEASYAAMINETTVDPICHSVVLGERRALYEIVRQLKPERILEIGTYLGVSTCYMAKALEANRAGSITTVDKVDVNSDSGPWQCVGLREPPHGMLEQLGVDHRVKFVTASSEDHLARDPEPYDLIFLDGDHSAIGVYKDITNSLGALRPHGVIVLHDFYPGGYRLFENGRVIPGPYVAVRRLQRENPELTVIPLSPLPWATGSGTQNTSLAVLARS